jgi:thiamine kinase-like enzyme
MRIGDALHGCSPQDAALVIDQLARFHALWWDHPQLETFSWLPRWGGDPQMAQDRYIQCLGPFLQRFGSHVPERIRKILDALATNYGAVRMRLKLAPATLVHADLHLDNILFSSLGSEPSLALIDWQSVARGRCAIDLALFLFGSLETMTRRHIEGDLFKRYYQLLIAGGVTGYDFTQLLADCRLALLWLLGAQVVWLGSMDLEHLDRREQALVNASLSEDSFDAALDHDVGSLLPL